MLPDRSVLRAAHYEPEASVLARLLGEVSLDAEARQTIGRDGLALIEAVRRHGHPGLLDGFLAEFGLDSTEGLALMSLAEALLRVPDQKTVDALIADKIAPLDWSARDTDGQSPLLGFSSIALKLTAEVLSPGEHAALAPLHDAVRRLGEPVIRTAIGQAMRVLGSQFVFGRTIAEAVRHASRIERQGYRFSYDMLGEAAMTAADATRYAEAYSNAIDALAGRSGGRSVRDNPGISIKLSALHPRYEFAQSAKVLRELVGTTRELARQAARANIGFNIDAEEQSRLDLSLDVIAAVLEDEELAGWEGFGVVVQAYGRRAAPLIDWLDALAAHFGRRIMVRLVKGAYWDTEIKRAQTLGLPDFLVFTRKPATDVSYIACARRLLATDRIYPQFATHNAHTAAAILELARQAGETPAEFEFQRLHGMGEALHEALRKRHGTISRIYAPIGAHRDLLAYLVRRLLENGAGASFVHQIADPDVPAEAIVADPIARIAVLGDEAANPVIARPADIFQPLRANSRGWDLSDALTVGRLDADRDPLRHHQWSARPIVAGPVAGQSPRRAANPALPADIVGTVVEASLADVETALAAATSAAPAWAATPVGARADILRGAADLYERHVPEFLALIAREAGKTLPDAMSEIREASDFLRYYAGEAERKAAGRTARGVFACISPWNFPLAIFTGQIAAALAAGNAVIAKPAEATPLVAFRAVELLHEAGIPAAALQFLPGSGKMIGGALTGDPRIGGVCFTGSLTTARSIERTMAPALSPDAPLIAETGGINAMIVDSTALPEQIIRDVVSSAFQSAGQRCSALRMLYVQQEAYERTLTMLKGAMAQLSLGDPWLLETDIGPLINRDAQEAVSAYVDECAADGRLLHQLAAAVDGRFVGPAVIWVEGIADIPREVFGPVLHVASYRAQDFDAVVAAINAKGFGLTFAIHSRIASRVEAACRHAHIGNIYVNRNQIGAVVASQPFGGEGLSGTGPKAGGPSYVERFLAPSAASPAHIVTPAGPLVAPTVLQAALDRAPHPARDLAGAPTDMPGPTGERNQLYLAPRGVVLCLGPTADDIALQRRMAEQSGNTGLCAAPGPSDTPALWGIEGTIEPSTLTAATGYDAVISFADDATLRAIRIALSRRGGPLIPLVTRPDDVRRLMVERHVCTDLTAAGGNAALIAAAAG